MSSAKLIEARREAEQSPLAWMIVLEQARKQNNFERAAEAQRELKKLGVNVAYSRKALAHV